MSLNSKKSRLSVRQPLVEDQYVELTESQSHYVIRVLRLRKGGQILLFNGHDGEWMAEIVSFDKVVRLKCIYHARVQINSPDVWLLMAPLKPSRTEFAIEKSVELGVSKIEFVSTDRSVKRSIKYKRLNAIANEAAEQCGGMDVPQINEIKSLDDVLNLWDESRKLLFCDEEAVSMPFPYLSQDNKFAIIIGPEGGFTEAERSKIETLEYSHKVSLGPRILRAETAVISALTLVHASSRK